MRIMNFYKKELFEILKTSKLIILPAVYLFFGLLGPLSARYTNELLKAMGSSLGGAKVILPDPTYIDSYFQYYKNGFFILIVVVILTFMGAVAEEKTKGTAVLVLTKCLSRTNFILSKFFGALTLFTAGFLLSAIAFGYYTYILFDKGIDVKGLVSLLIFWVFGCYMLSIVIFSSTISKTQMGGAVLSFLGYAVSVALPAMPGFDKYSPGALQGLGLGIINGVNTVNEVMPACLITLGIAAIFVALSILSFRKQEV